MHVYLLLVLLGVLAQTRTDVAAEGNDIANEFFFTKSSVLLASATRHISANISLSRGARCLAICSSRNRLLMSIETYCWDLIGWPVVAYFVT